MGVRYPSVAVIGVGAGLPGSAAETAIYTTPPLNISLDFSQIFIFWAYTLLAGTGTTNVIFRLRRGPGTGGTQLNVNPNALPLAAGANGLFSGCYADTPGAVAGQQYTLTIVQTGATVGGINADGCLLVFAL